jgi:hypothetical protein
VYSDLFKDSDHLKWNLDQQTQAKYIRLNQQVIRQNISYFETF